MRRAKLQGEAALERGERRGARARWRASAWRTSPRSRWRSTPDGYRFKNAEAHAAANKAYEWGFSSDIEQEFAPKGLSEDTVRFISAKKDEPEWMLEWRLKAYRLWLTMEMPDWAKLNVDPIDYQDAYYYAEPKAKPKLGSLDEVDPEILRVYEKLGIPISEQKLLAGVVARGGCPPPVAVDAVFD